MEMPKTKKNKFPLYKKEIPYLSTEQMIEVDRLMIEKYHIELIQMMENAGRNLALLANKRFLGKKKKNKTVVILAGTGGNGGGALVCARRLFSWGFKIKAFVTDEDNMTKIPGHQLEILKNMNVPVESVENLNGIENLGLIIDGIIGYSLDGDPRGNAKTMIEWSLQQNVPILSLDTPSGIDLTEGRIYEPAIKATATLTLALPKQGLVAGNVRSQRGELYLGDISVPPSLYAEPTLGLSVNTIFKRNDIVKLD